MKRKTNVVIHAVTAAAQYAVAATELVPEEWRPLAALALAAVQGATGVRAHRFNPDGSPAEFPWIRKR